MTAASDGKSNLSPEIRQALLSRMRGAPSARAVGQVPNSPPPRRAKPQIETLDFFAETKLLKQAAAALNIENPFLRPHQSRAGAGTMIDGRFLLNFSSYDYLGLNGHPRVVAAAKAAVDEFGTSVSASRLVSGERPFHRALVRQLAALHGAEDCIVMVSGHATNVTVLGHIVGPEDLLIHDSLAHNSILEGARLSGARRISAPHGDALALEQLLAKHAPGRRRTLVVVESHYSMDGDIPDLPSVAAACHRHGAWLMVDEAHSIGVLGRTGRGACEHFGLNPDDVDLWMGSLSKTLAACGGYIAGSAQLVSYLKLTAPGFVYSVGLAPPIAAAALAAAEVMADEPDRVARLNANALRFREGATAAGLNTGRSEGKAIVPIIIGSSLTAARVSQRLGKAGVNVQPILYPAVAERSARLRFFLSSEHSEAMIDKAIEATAEAVAAIGSDQVDLDALAVQLTASTLHTP